MLLTSANTLIGYITFDFPISNNKNSTKDTIEYFKRLFIQIRFINL